MQILILKPLLQQAYKSKKKRKVKLKPVFVSRKDELAYIKELTAIAKICTDQHGAIIDALQPRIGDSGFIGDGLLDRAKQALQRAKTEVLQKVGDAVVDRIARTMVEIQQRQVTKTLADQLRRQTGLDLAGILSDADLAGVVSEGIAANTALIKSLPEQHFYNIEQTILNGLQLGHSTEQIAKSLTSVGVKTMNRARLIASDQIGKINGRLTQVRHEKLGVTHYYWITCNDERVRHLHKQRHNLLFAWANPPSDGHPGMPIKCRCHAMPYLMHLLDDSEPTGDELMKNQDETK